MAVKVISAAWRGLEKNSSERLDLRHTPFEIKAVSTYTEKEYQVSYEISCDPLWRTREVVINANNETLKLLSDREGTWYKNGVHIPELTGAIDIDLTITPFTNTLPIRRLNLNEGQSADIRVVYLTFPQLEIRIDRQRYTNIGNNIYGFDALDTGFRQDIQIDAEGLVINYPDLFVRAVAKRQ